MMEPWQLLDWEIIKLFYNRCWIEITSFTICGITRQIELAVKITVFTLHRSPPLQAALLPNGLIVKPHATHTHVPGRIVLKEKPDTSPRLVHFSDYFSNQE